MDWKALHILKLIILVLNLSLGVQAQNLVPNPSFEEYSECPDNLGQIERSDHWLPIVGLAEYFNECGQNGFGIPVSRWGGYARTGQAYGHVTVWSKSAPNGREFIGTELLEELSAGVKYRVEFYVSMADSLWYATKNIGLHISTSEYAQNVNDLIGLTPQLSYDDSSYLDNKIRWMLIAGSYTAQGGERYIAIGNFDSDSETDTLFIAGGGSESVQSSVYWEGSGYFVDDVSVIPDSIYLSNNDIETREPSLNLYPNPNSGFFNVKLQLPESETAQLNIWSITGQHILSRNLGIGQNQLQMNVSNGLYLYTVTINGELKWTGKLSISSN